MRMSPYSTHDVRFDLFIGFVLEMGSWLDPFTLQTNTLFGNKLLRKKATDTNRGSASALEATVGSCHIYYNYNKSFIYF